MIDIVFDNKNYSIPEKWDEVPEKVRLRVLEIVFATPENGTAYHELLRTLLGINQRAWAKLMRRFFSDRSTEKTIEKNAEILQELLDMLKWMWNADEIARPFEFIEHDNTKFYLFEEGFRSMSFGELTDAYIHAHSFIKQLEEGDKRLNLLLATICRPHLKPPSSEGDIIEKWNGDARIPYNSHISNLIESKFKDIPSEKKILALVYFLGQLKDFLSYYDIYDDEGREANEDYPGQGYIKNQHLLSEKGIFGNMTQTKAANVHDVFLFLEENKKDIKEQIRLQKAQENANSN